MQQIACVLSEYSVVYVSQWLVVITYTYVMFGGFFSCLLLCGSTMEESDRRRLVENMVALENDLDVPALYGHLIQGDVLSHDDVELIDAQMTRRDKAMKFLGILPTKGPRAFAVFVGALKKSQFHLHELLAQGAGSTCPASDAVFLGE